MDVSRFAIFWGKTVMHAIVFVEFLNYFRVRTANSLKMEKLEKLGSGWSRFFGVPQGQVGGWEGGVKVGGVWVACPSGTPKNPDHPEPSFSIFFILREIATRN